MRPVLAGAILGVLLVAVSGLVWLVAGKPGALAIFAGGILPVAISTGSLVIFFTRMPRRGGYRQYQRFVLTNFLVKVVFIGLWTALVLLTTSLPRGPFVFSLLVNFFAWHVFEAYRYQSTLGAPAARPGKGTST